LVAATKIDAIRGPFAANAGVVDQDFDWPKRPCRLGPEALDGDIVRHVALKSQRPPAVAADRGSDRFRAFRIVVVTERDLRAVGGESRCDGCADATTSAADEGDPVLKPRKCRGRCYPSKRKRPTRNS
jgi:hypothetical protein